MTTLLLIAASASVLLHASPVRRPPTPDLRPPTTDLRPPTSDHRPPTSDLRPPTSTLHPPPSTLRPPTSDLHPPPSDLQRPLDAKIEAASVTVRQLTYAQLDGSRNAATLVEPGAGRNAAMRPAILFLHWYGPPDPSSNRTQFLPEAVELAGNAVVSLLVDTPWTRERWFGQRDSAKDYEFTVQMAKDVRRALDVLLAQPRIDLTRVAVVGHDFGAMWGALAVAADPRVTHFVYAAGTASFTDWYLYTPKREGTDREAFVAKLAPLDPINFLPKIAPRPVLLQFGTKDPHVKNDAAKAQADATKDPKTVKIYDNAEHELTFQARLDRLAWLKEQFKIK